MRHIKILRLLETLRDPGPRRRPGQDPLFLDRPPGPSAGGGPVVIWPDAAATAGCDICRRGLAPPAEESPSAGARTRPARSSLTDFQLDELLRLVRPDPDDAGPGPSPRGRAIARALCDETRVLHAVDRAIADLSRPRGRRGRSFR